MVDLASYILCVRRLVPMHVILMLKLFFAWQWQASLDEGVLGVYLS